MGSYSNNTKVQTLSTVEELSDVQFGHRFPRHGLKLLHWLAEDFIEFDASGMLAKHDPRDGAFGFHPFRNDEKILPKLPANSKYFEVGNLHYPSAQDLPFDQVEQENDESNTDRIIVRLDHPGLVIAEVYITDHTPHRSSFDARATFRLSDDLIQQVKDMDLEEFLQQAGYVPGPNENFTKHTPQRMERKTTPKKNELTVVDMPDSYYPRDDSVCGCIIL